MSSSIYASTKVIPLARETLKFVAVGEKMQDKIIHAVSPIPLCEIYLADIGSSIPRPAWLVRNNVDLGEFARLGPYSEQTTQICSMAPQHKSELLQDLIDWWVSALGVAFACQATQHRGNAQ